MNGQDCRDELVCVPSLTSLLPNLCALIMTFVDYLPCSLPVPCAFVHPCFDYCRPFTTHPPHCSLMAMSKDPRAEPRYKERVPYVVVWPWQCSSLLTCVVADGANLFRHSLAACDARCMRALGACLLYRMSACWQQSALWQWSSLCPCALVVAETSSCNAELSETFVAGAASCAVHWPVRFRQISAVSHVRLLASARSQSATT